MNLWQRSDRGHRLCNTETVVYADFRIAANQVAFTLPVFISIEERSFTRISLSEAVSETFRKLKDAYEIQSDLVLWYLEAILNHKTTVI